MIKDKDVKEFVENVGGYTVCRHAGLAATMQAFYCGVDLSNNSADSSEIADDLGLSNGEYNYWVDLWYKKDSWFNQLEGR